MTLRSTGHPGSRYLAITMVVGLAGLVAYRMPGLSPSFIQRYNDDFAFCAMAAVLSFGMFRRAVRAEGLEERRLWRWLGWSFALWCAAELLASVDPAMNDPGPQGIPTDLLFFASYSAWILGINQAPHHPEGWTRLRPSWRLDQVATGILTFGLAVDLVLLGPFAASAPAPPRVFSTGLFVAYDTVILLRLLLLHGDSSGTWARWYRVMAYACLGMLLLDIVATGADWGLLPAWEGPWYDLAWYIPFWLLGHAVDLPVASPRAAATDPTAMVRAEVSAEVSGLWQSGVVLYPVAFASLHVVAGAVQDDSPAARVREVASLLVLLALGTAALARHRRTRARISQLTRDLEETADAELRERKAVAVTGLAGEVAHELNNDLTVIMGNCGLLEAAARNRGGVTESLEEIRAAAERAAGFVAALLDVTGPRRFQPRRMDLGLILDDTLAGVVDQTPVHLRTSLGSGTPPILGDPALLQEALRHLARNAVEAMPGGGHLTIEVHGATLGPALQRRPVTVPPGRYACLAVEDTGTGMTPEIQARLFEPFFTTKSFGRAHGLGLVTVLGIVRQHEGHLVVHSETDRGTRVTIYVPAHAPVPVGTPLEVG